MLTQYTVTWNGKKFLLYAKDKDDAKKQVGAPEDAYAYESDVSDREIKNMITRGMWG